jgi:hypothetical protein
VGGTVVLLHDLRRTFRERPQRPYRDLFEVLQAGATREELVLARERAGSEPRAIAAYRNGDAPHPALPYVDWAACGPVLERAGRVVVGGCRDAAAARTLGLVPAHSPAAAIEMADGVTGGEGRTGVLLGPPYAPLVVS